MFQYLQRETDRSSFQDKDSDTLQEGLGANIDLVRKILGEF
jgi:hypothetical protein